MRTMPATTRLDAPLAPGTPSVPGVALDVWGASPSPTLPAGKGSPQRGHSGRGPGATSPSWLLQYGHVTERNVLTLRSPNDEHPLHCFANDPGWQRARNRMIGVPYLNGRVRLAAPRPLSQTGVFFQVNLFV